MNREAEGKDERRWKDRCLPSLFICCKDASLCMCVCVPIQQSPSLEQHTEWEITTDWGSAFHTPWHRTYRFINLYNWLQRRFPLLKLKIQKSLMHTNLRSAVWIWNTASLKTHEICLKAVKQSMWHKAGCRRQPSMFSFQAVVGTSLQCFSSDLIIFNTKSLCNHAGNAGCSLTVNDSLLRPLVMNVNPCVSMATPVFCMCSSTYLKWQKSGTKCITNDLIARQVSLSVDYFYK